MKFLVLWRIDIALLNREVLKVVMTMPDYAEPLEQCGKVLARYHIPGAHGGAWIYDVESNEELDMLLARSPVFNFSRYEIYPLAEMTPPRPERPPTS
ncbi:MAG: muconolactone Delta-isomerase family protein [Candidatus Binatia bacterium]